MCTLDEAIHTMEVTIRRHRMIKRGDRVVAAISGGADSTLLLHGLSALRQRLGFQLVAASLDHGLRPGSREDVAWVKRQCAALTVPCHTGTAVVSPGPGTEARAREIRTRFLTAVARSHDATVLALGHNRTDRMETLLMNVHRGTGLRGLSAMAPVSENRVRPLIELDRQAIRSALRTAGMTWREDETNRDIRLLRNRIRQNVTPVLAASFDGNPAEAWANMGDRAAGELRVMRQLLDRMLAPVLRVNPDGFQLPAEWWRELDDDLAGAVAMRLLERLMGSSFRLNRQMVADAAAFFRKTGKGEWRPFRDAALLLVRSGARVYLLTSVPAPGRTIGGPGRYPGWFGELVVESAAEAPPGAVRIDPNRFPFPWLWEPLAAAGDRWADVDRRGTPIETAKKRRWGWFERQYAPVLKWNNAVLWVPGDAQINTGPVKPGAVAVYTVEAIGYNPASVFGGPTGPMMHASNRRQNR